MSKERFGSIIVQKEYQKGDNDIKNKIFDSLKSEILVLTKDSFGNYVIQTILHDGDKEKINKIFDIIKNNVFDLSYHRFGCRVLQTLIEISGNTDKDKIKIILRKLENLYGLFVDQNGNHVIQKIIDKLNFEEINDIYNEVIKYANNLICDIYGTRIIQSVLKKCNEEQGKKIIEKILKVDKDKFIDLCKDKYANYTLQFILENFKSGIEYFLSKIKGNIYIFSLDKCASNIVEKLLEYGNKEQRVEIVKEIIEKDNKDKDCILKLCNNKYGNHIVQKLIEYCSDEDNKIIIINRVMSISEKNRKVYWKYVYNFIDSNYKNLSMIIQ